jgi:APA family basic amino acid/polyamine antiporter
MAVALVMGNMIGSGIFLLPASLAPYGSVSLAGWAVSAGGAMMLALVFARLARLNPAAGGPYAYTREAFGDLPGFLVAWGYWISMWTSLGALATAFVGYLDPFMPTIVRQPPLAALLALAVLWLLIGINIIGVRTAAWVQATTTVLKVLPLAAVGLAGLVFFDSANLAAPASAVEGMRAIPAVVTLTLWAFVGLESATVPTENIHEPDRTIPRATVTGTALAAGVYIVSTIGVMGVLSPLALQQSTAPFADAARAMGGETAAAVIALGAAISCFGCLNGWVLLVGQLPVVVARDGLFPSLFARMTSRGTPAAGMIVAGLLTTALIAMNYTRGLVELFTFMILLSTLNTLIPYAFSSLAVFILQPRREALGGAIGSVAALAFVYSFWAIAGAGQDTVYYGFLLLVSGLPVYVWMQRTRRV